MGTWTLRVGLEFIRVSGSGSGGSRVQRVGTEGSGIQAVYAARIPSIVCTLKPCSMFIQGQRRGVFGVTPILNENHML